MLEDVSTISVSKTVYEKFKKYCEQEGYIIKTRVEIALVRMMTDTGEIPISNIDKVKSYIIEHKFTTLTEEGVARAIYYACGVHNRQTLKDYRDSLIRDRFIEAELNDEETLYNVLGV